MNGEGSLGGAQGGGGEMKSDRLSRVQAISSFLAGAQDYMQQKHGLQSKDRRDGRPSG